MTLSAGDILNYEYTGSKQTITLPKGVYKLECWGAQGGYRSNATYGGKGAYVTGTISLPSATTIHIYVGGSGRTGGTSGGFNGGGARSNHYGGGGATDIRVENDSLYARVLVAAGGGSDGAKSKKGMYGGADTGGTTTQNYGTGGGGATQTAGGTGSSSKTGKGRSGTYGDFGIGGTGYSANSGHAGAGGGGWYGGAGSYPDSSSDDDRGGGGGSSYVYTATTATNYPSGCLLNSSYYLTDTQKIAGNASMIGTSGTAETGHSGDGYARITVISVTIDFIKICGLHGTITSDVDAADPGGSVTFTIIPEQYYKLDTLLVDDIPVVATLENGVYTYTKTDITDTFTIVAEFYFYPILKRNFKGELRIINTVYKKVGGTWVKSDIPNVLDVNRVYVFIETTP